MNTLIKYLLAILTGLVGIALVFWFLYELFRNLPVILMTLGFIAVLALLIILVERIRQKS